VQCTESHAHDERFCGRNPLTAFGYTRTLLHMLSQADRRSSYSFHTIDTTSPIFFQDPTGLYQSRIRPTPHMWIGGSRPRMDRKRCEACTASSSVRPAQPSAPLVACVSRRPGCRHSSSSGPRPRSVKIMEIRGTPPSPASAAAGVTRGDINRGRPASLLGRRLLSVSPLLGPRPRCYDQAASTSTPGRAGTGVACSICDAHADRPGTRGA
jgi:hypothetical protein